MCIHRSVPIFCTFEIATLNKKKVKVNTKYVRRDEQIYSSGCTCGFAIITVTVFTKIKYVHIDAKRMLSECNDSLFSYLHHTPLKDSLVCL